MELRKLFEEILSEEKFDYVFKYQKWCDNYNKDLLKKYDFKSKEFEDNALYVDMDKAMKEYSQDDKELYNKLKEFYSKD